MDSNISEPDGAMGEAGVVEQDTLCTRCGYNLRGLSPDGRCPECGTEIEQSLHGDLLRHADPDWLETVRFGITLKLWNIGLTIVVTVAAGVLVAMGLPQSLLMVLGLAGGVFGLWASFVITIQEPRISLQEDPVTWRRAIRVCAVAALIGSLPEMAGSFGGLGVVLRVAGGVLGLAGIVSTFGELLYFSRFARRIPNEKLAKNTRFLMWAIPTLSLIAGAIGMLVIVLGVIPGTVAVGTAPAAGPAVAAPALPAPLLIAFGCIFALAGLIFFVLYVGLLVRYRGVFTKAAAQSREPAAGNAANSDGDKSL